MLLAGDIGGTKTDLAVFTSEAGPRAPLAQAEFPSAQYSGLEAVARAFLERVRLPVTSACFAVAGPVLAGRAELTNLPWVLDEAQLARDLNLTAVHLLNDLEAIAGAVPLLQPNDLHSLAPGEPVLGGAIAVVAPGTGLGEAFLTWDGTRYRAHASEGGHADFAPNGAQQIELLRYLQARYGHVSAERVCSGLGIPHIYAFLRDQGCASESTEVARRLGATTDWTPVIFDAALDPTEPSPLCTATLETFIAILGAEAGNLALKVLATGGVYLGGGIPGRILRPLDDGRFLKAFREKGRFSELLARVPVHVIVQRAALIGAASFGLDPVQ